MFFITTHYQYGRSLLTRVEVSMRLAVYSHMLVFLSVLIKAYRSHILLFQCWNSVKLTHTLSSGYHTEALMIWKCQWNSNPSVSSDEHVRKVSRTRNFFIKFCDRIRLCRIYWKHVFKFANINCSKWNPKAFFTLSINSHDLSFIFQ